MPMVVQELVADDPEVQEALADPLEAVQEITQAGPYAFHRVAVHTCPIQVTTRILAGAMVDRPMVIVDLSEMVNVVLISEELRPDFHLSGNDGFDGRSAHIPQHFQIDWRSGRAWVSLVTALHQAQQGWTPELGGGSTAQLNLLLDDTPLTERIGGAIARLRPSSATTPKTHPKAEPAQQTVLRRKNKPRRRALHRQEGRPQGHDNRYLQHGFQGKPAIGRVKPATSHPSEDQAKEQSTHGHDATLQKPCAHLLLPSPLIAGPSRSAEGYA
jgi:hypothetical protein